MKKGSSTIYILLFGTAFLISFTAILNLILSEIRFTRQRVAWNGAFEIAEAGIQYYKWCLNHQIEDSCLNEKNYYDPEGKLIGKFFIETEEQVSCGQTIQKRIISHGWTNQFPNLKRKIKVIYGRESIAKYSYVLNSNVWIGSDHEIRGPYHSNGGIRMDGENQSLVISSQEKWICTSSFGCSSCPVSAGCYLQNNNCFCPGVFTTANGNDGLFSFPVPSFDFAGITVDLNQLKNLSQTLGIYLPPSKNLNPNALGYHLIFKNNGQVEVRIITGLSSTYSYSLEENWHYDYFTITSEYFYQSFNIPSSCSVIFVEDNLWPEGEIKGKVTLASANLIEANKDTDTILFNNIDYTLVDGSDGFALISERNILIGPQSPNKMELRGIFLAQKGRFARNHYPGNIKEKLEIYGSIISNGRVGTQWVSGSQIISGYLKRESYFDSSLIYNPPPFVPYLEPDFKLIQWQEI